MDVLVIGAGPAGATAARALAMAGVTVRLLDRSKFPRNKPCGGGISLRVLPRFPYLEQALAQDCHAPGVAALPGRPGRRFGRRPLARPGGANGSPGRVRRAAGFAGVRGWCGAGRRRRHRGRVPGPARRQPDGSRRASVYGSGRDRGRWRAQRRRTAPGHQPRMARHFDRARHDGGIAAPDAARRRSLHDVGRVRRQRRSGIRIHLSEAGSCERRDRLPVEPLPSGGRRASI